jgi:glycine cleavage system H protein
MSYPENLQYTKEHEWILIEGENATIGVTAYAIEQLGDVVHIDLPKTGKVLSINESFGTIESTKTVSDLYSPAAGTITEINSRLANEPEFVAEAPHSTGWLIKIKLSGAPENLMNASDYAKYIS